MRVLLMVAALSGAACGRDVTAGSSASKAPRWWYCHAMNPFTTAPRATIDDLVVFTTCEREENMDRCDGSTPCVVAPYAWAGKEKGTFTYSKRFCEEITGNGPCHLEKP
jgi:hypothetical protein